MGVPLFVAFGSPVLLSSCQIEQNPVRYISGRRE